MLDFTQKKKKKLPVKLHDGFVALLPMPSKAIFDEIIDVGDIKNADGMYKLVEMIVNQNQKKKYTAETINKMFDFEDATEFVKEYIKFVTEVTSSPN